MNENEEKKQQFYFKGKFFDNEEDFMKFAYDWQYLESDEDTFKEEWNNLGKDLWLNLNIRKKITNGALISILQENFMHMIRKIL